MFVGRRAPFSESDARAAIACSSCWADALRRLGYEPRGRNYETLKRHATEWGIAVDHFDPNVGRRRAASSRRASLSEVLVADSTYPRGLVKSRLFKEGLKDRRCEMCGQGEVWNGARMSLVLDHINGVFNDHRLENLRIVCPNCAATLDTHCGRNLPRERICPGCNSAFTPHDIRHRYCSQKCWGRVHSREDFFGAGSLRGVPVPRSRKVERPPYERLLEEIAASSYVAVGRKYGVSDNAVRKWIRWYERERARVAALAA